MAVSTGTILDEIDRAVELLAPLTSHPNAREALKIVTQVGFVLAAEQRADTVEDDGYDADYLTDEDSGRDRIAEVVAMGGEMPYALYPEREYDRD